jgi:hypothetical protein
MTATRRQTAAAVLSLAVVSLLVLRASSAAFTATTANPGNSFAAGAIDLSDDDSDTALFSVTGMFPGETETRCINVTYTGDVVGGDLTVVRLYASGTFTDAGAVADHLHVDVDLGSGASDTDCTGFTEPADVVAEDLATFSARTGFATGVSTGWTPSASPETVSFRITVTLDAAAPDTVQGQSLSDVGFTWEVQTA